MSCEPSRPMCSDAGEVPCQVLIDLVYGACGNHAWQVREVSAAPRYYATTRYYATKPLSVLPPPPRGRPGRRFTGLHARRLLLRPELQYQGQVLERRQTRHQGGGGALRLQRRGGADAGAGWDRGGSTAGNGAPAARTAAGLVVYRGVNVH